MSVVAVVLALLVAAVYGSNDVAKGLATLTRLPVSTTHSLVGALLGAGLLAAPHAVHWPVLAGEVAVPLLASALAAYGLSALLGLAAPGGDQSALRAVVLPLPSLAAAGRRTLTGLHWASAGAVSAARGLPAGVPPAAVTVAVAVALLAGGRVARRLGEDVVALDDAAGLRANLTTALVGAGAGYGLPMSTTHVSTGAIAGTAGARLDRLHARTLRDFALGWTVTPLVAGLVAAAVALLLKG